MTFDQLTIAFIDEGNVIEGELIRRVFEITNNTVRRCPFVLVVLSLTSALVPRDAASVSLPVYRLA